MKRVLVLFVIGVVFFGGCSAQNVNAQNANNGQRIIGTWVAQTGETWVFNANGNLIISGEGGRSTAYMYMSIMSPPDGQYKFVVTDIHLALSTNTQVFIHSFSISSDGKTLIVDFSNGVGLWLTKK